MLSNSEFFNQLSDDYDDMINFENSLINKQNYLKQFISSKNHYALDLGCGTGADSIALSKLGLKVDAVDHSKGMIDQAVQNSQRFDTKINFIHSNLVDFTISGKTYNVIVSLGNTFVNVSFNNIKTILKKLYTYLNESGSIVIQIINYSKLPTTGSYLLNTFENDAVSIIRKYNIRANSIDFIIDKTDKGKGEKSQMITKLYPHSENDFNQLANEIGFKMEVYGNLKKAPFAAKESPNLVVVLTK